MMYHLNDLLTKMGAPEVRDRGQIEWHYFDKTKNALAGYAEIRLEAAGERLIAELKRLHENYEDDNGRVHADFVETFHLFAERTARPEHYRVTRVAFDGDVYDNPPKAVIELGLSVFHARALDISIRMVEQTFNKQDILDPVEARRPALRQFMGLEKTPPRQESYGVVVPFKPRTIKVG